MNFANRAFVFDLGGTLIEYEGLPFSWADFYEEAFHHIDLSLALHLDRSQIGAAIKTLRKYNARINPREIEYSADVIFSEAIQSWGVDKSANEIASHFYRQFQKRAKPFPDATDVLMFLTEKGFQIGILTDLPTGMPEELVREDVALLGCKIDRLLTSVEVGFRKPNRAGLDQLAKEFGMATDQLVFVGDEGKDIQAAKIVGAVSIFINRKSIARTYGENFQISTLSNIKELVSENERRS